LIDYVLLYLIPILLLEITHRSGGSQRTKMCKDNEAKL
jgi:hypothetical protein